MQTQAEFHMPQTVFYGPGSFTLIGEQVSFHGNKALIISDHIMEKMGLVSQCQDYLAKANCDVAVYLNVDSEPTDIHVAESLDMFSYQKCNVIVALGGGSCLDTAKAVAVVASNGGYINDYVGRKAPLKNTPIPLIVAPTTAGTGSEVTCVTIITNTKNDVKLMIKHLGFMPSVAIVDPNLTCSLPPHVTAATGLDALCHAIEAYISKLAHPLTDIMALRAIKLINENLLRAYKNGNDLEAREKMSLAAMQAGIAFSNASVCLIHGMSRPIGAMFHVPHGVSNAMLLPVVLEFSKESAKARLTEIARMLKFGFMGSDHEMIDLFIQDIKQLCRNLKIPNMQTWGIEPKRFAEVIPKMAADALASGSPNHNPRVPTVEEISELYRISFNYRY
ncbi:iron-containing alcohol dehydrogenase [Desulforamulus aeronauticus]|uniref:Iron-containing alcohol dehydrogenase n=1 Tax=Desulforamulus aeronauticus DSM 10349 TaxID=1121421 RepID=A0A1M6S0N2_9FIRM|nr:iron-containing alcohol dehydrogenase [Desulforamulus aeronauticus]SHK38147.1 Iron-containing alcohol dehydrogenase [Desulforamulus aeronauticus DSM 10349]